MISRLRSVVVVRAERQMLGTTASNQGWTVPSDADAPLRAFLDIHNMLPAADKSMAESASAGGGAPVGYELRQANAPSVNVEGPVYVPAP